MQLHRNPNYSCVQEEPEEVRSLEDVHDRMHELNVTVGVFQNLFMGEAPVVARRFFCRQFLTELVGHGDNMAKVSAIVTPVCSANLYVSSLTNGY